MTSGLMRIPQAHHGFGITREMLAEPVAQVPLLRSSQRDPSNSGHRPGNNRVSGETLTPPWGGEHSRLLAY